MNHPTRLALLVFLCCLILSSCIEFEHQKLSYIHNEAEDELRITLTYKGIFGNLDQEDGFQNSPGDIATEDRLNQKQSKQLESVLEQKRAFFFSNWIAEYSASSSGQMLEKIIQRNDHGRFGKPEIEMIELLRKSVDVQNIGFYQDNMGKLCGGQTIKISNISKVLASANEVIRRQIVAHIPQMQEEREKDIPGSWSPETIALIEKKLTTEFPFIQLEGNLLTFSAILSEKEQKKLTEDSLKDWPPIVRIEFSKEGANLLIGGKADKVVNLSKKCFDGYYPNALSYIQIKHGNLLLPQKEIENTLSNFLNAAR